MVKLNKGKRPVKRPNVKTTTNRVSGKLILSLALALLAVIIYTAGYRYSTEAKQARELEVKVQELESKKIEVQQKEAEGIQKQQTIEELNKQIEEKNKQLEAKVNRQRALAEAEQNKREVAVVTNPGNCSQWMAEAGIPLTTATQKLILNESGCRTNAVNPSSGACGIPQAYPCSKLPCPLNDSGAVCQLQWMNTYVQGRYGSWENALSTWYSRCGSPQGCWY